MLSLLAAVLIAQMPAAPTPEPAWHGVLFFGQPVQVFGTERDGRVYWRRSDVGMVAPAARKEADQIDQRPLPTPTPQARPINYGVMADKLASDKRVIRASDPETLRVVTEAAARRKPCPGPNCPDEPDDAPERKPGLIERAENEVERLLLYGVVGVLTIASVVLVVKSKQPQA